MKKISVMGLGRLGLPLALAFESRGLDVVGVDIDDRVRTMLAKRIPPFFESGIAQMLENSKMRITDSILEAVRDTDVSIIIVNTPSCTDGAFSLEHVTAVCEEIGRALKTKEDYHLAIVSSTVNPGDCAELLHLLETTSRKKLGEFGFCHSPEFVALGEIVKRLTKPDFILIGAEDDKSKLAADGIYRVLAPDAPIVHTNLINAELAKIWLNVFLVTKMTLANQIAEMCEVFPGADVDVITKIIGMDRRVSPRCLTGATAVGGPCFPRDVVSVSVAAKKAGVSLPLADVMNKLNRHQLDRLVARIDAMAPSVKTVGVLGLAYKPGVDSLVQSVGLGLVRHLVRRFKVIAYDPMIMIEQSVQSAQKCVDGSDVVIVTTPCPEAQWVDFHEGQVVVDCWRMLDQFKVEATGAKYVAIGRGTK